MSRIARAGFRRQFCGPVVSPLRPSDGMHLRRADASAETVAEVLLRPLAGCRPEARPPHAIACDAAICLVAELPWRTQIRLPPAGRQRPPSTAASVACAQPAPGRGVQERREIKINAAHAWQILHQPR